MVPGVLLVEGMAQTAGIAVGGPNKFFLLSAIRSMKFLRPVRPEEPIGFSARKLGDVGGLVQCAVEARVGEQLSCGRPNHSHGSLVGSVIARMALIISFGKIGRAPAFSPVCFSQVRSERPKMNEIIKKCSNMELSMKKIAIALCLGLLIGLPAASTHAQLVVAKQGATTSNACPELFGRTT